jgi:hypothetical protein
VGSQAATPLSDLGVTKSQSSRWQKLGVISPLIDNVVDNPPSAPASNLMVDGKNLAMVCCRQQSVPGFRHVWVSNLLVERCLVSNRTREGCSIYPVHASGSDLLSGSKWGMNIIAVPATGLPDDESALRSFHYIYAVLHSQQYRQRYEAQLAKDFPRIPTSKSLTLFQDLARIGYELVDLHLMESTKLDRFITIYTGPKNPEVERVGWSDDTVWLDAAVAKKAELAGPGSMGFRGVPIAVWNFRVGSYQVCAKWLKDRKGRTLSNDDIAHYHKIVVALSETIRLIKEIDEVIENHGGWPGAFQSSQNE